MNYKEEYLELKKQIEYHNDRYYNQDNPEITDYEYDQLSLKVRKLEKEHPELITNDSPSKKVGGTTKREAGVTVKHNVPMLSIQDVFNKEDVITWIREVKRKYPDAKFSVEKKIDGLSATLRYRNGNLELTETRGDGFVGEDVTLNSLEIKDIVKNLDIPYNYLEIRGEVYMSHEDFDKTNERQEILNKKLFANPRNCAAGTLRQLDPMVTKERGLRMFIFNIQDGDKELTYSHTKGLEYLASKGISVVPHKLCNTEEEIINEIDLIGETRGDLPYDIDGAVIKIDQIEYRKDFTFASKYSNGHIAYKYPPEEKETIVKDIRLTVGRTGRITPTAIFETIRLCGTNVEKATLHNQDRIDELDVRIGDTIIVRKAGEIIPEVLSVVKEKRPENTVPFIISSTCPSCGQPTSREEDTADIKCTNVNCPAQLIRTISNFVGRSAMDIKNFGEAYIESLINEGFIHNYADIYKLKYKRDELVKKGIMGKDKNTDKILLAIEESKKNDPTMLLTGLGIRNVGKQSAKEIMKHFNSITELADTSLSKLMTIEDVGETTAKSIADFFSNDINKEIINVLLAENVNMSVNKNDNGTNKLEGLTFVVTGTLPTKGRKEIETLIDINGGKCSGSVSKKTSYLLVGEDAGSKLEKAKSLGISIITEEQFLDMIK